REIRKDFMTDHARLARARRLIVRVEFINQVHGKLQQEAMLDTGAPFSVVPFSVWHGFNLACSPLGSQFATLEGKVDDSALKWQGVPCQFGEVVTHLLDEADNRSRPLRMIAKLPRSPVMLHMESIVVLGYSFLADNNLTLTLHPGSRTTVGSLTDVVGFLRID